MGFFDKIKKKAQDAVNQAQHAVQGTPEQEAQPVPDYSASALGTTEEIPSGSSEPSISGPSFTWDGDTHALPTSFSPGLSMEDWFLKFETIRDELSRADEMTLEPMLDEDGDPLDNDEVLLISKYGFAHGGVFEAYRNYMVTQFAQQAGRSFIDLEMQQGTIAREKLMANKATAMGGAGGQMEPVEGVSLEIWAGLQAAVASSKDISGQLAQHGIDEAKWQRVSAEWNDRMSKDTTATIATAYGNAFSGAGQGQFGASAANAAAVGTGGDLGAEPVPFEKFVEVEQAMNAAATKGQDISSVLGSFGLNPVDWSSCGAYWSRRIMQEATTYHARYTELQAKFAAKYR